MKSCGTTPSLTSGASALPGHALGGALQQVPCGGWLRRRQLRPLVFLRSGGGRLPEEGTDEAATDTHVLELLGIEPKLGAKFTLTFDVDGHTTTQTFTLCGWWEYDEAIPADHVLIPESRLESILAETGYVPGQDASGAALGPGCDAGQLPATLNRMSRPFWPTTAIRTRTGRRTIM